MTNLENAMTLEQLRTSLKDFHQYSSGEIFLSVDLGIGFDGNGRHSSEYIVDVEFITERQIAHHGSIANVVSKRELSNWVVLEAPYDGEHIEYIDGGDNDSHVLKHLGELGYELETVYSDKHNNVIYSIKNLKK